MQQVGDLWFRKGQQAWVCYVNGKPKTMAKGWENKPAAEIARAKLLIAADASKDGGGENNANKTIGQLWPLYQDRQYPHSPPATRRRKEQMVLPFVERFKDTRLCDLKAHHIEDWLQKQTTWAEGTKAFAVKQVSAIFNDLCKADLISRNPCKGVKRPQEGVRGEEVVVEREDFARLLALARPYLARILKALWLAGARPTEILRAHADEFDSKTGYLRKKQHKNAKKGKARNILLPAEVQQMCEESLAANVHGWLFPGAGGGQPIQCNDFRERLVRLKNEAGLVGQVIPYSFRHSYAVRLLEAGLPDWQVAGLLGHSGVKHIHKHYAHTLARMEHKAAQIGDLIAAASAC